MSKGIGLFLAFLWSTNLFSNQCNISAEKIQGHFLVTFKGQQIPLQIVTVQQAMQLLDEGAKVTALDVALPTRANLTVVDHHDSYRNPKQPYANTATKIINKYTKIRHESRDHKQAVEELYKWAFGLDFNESPKRFFVTSDNIFDTDLSLAILLNPEWLETVQMRVLLKEMAFYQDFGVFSPVEVVSKEAETRLKVLLKSADDIIQKNIDVIRVGDRFKDDLTPARMHVIFVELVHNIRNAIEQPLDEGSQRALEYDREVEQMVQYIRTHAMMEPIEGQTTLSLFDEDKVKATPFSGASKNWRAMALAPTTAFQAQIGTTADGKVKFLLAGRFKEARIKDQILDAILAIVPENERAQVFRRDPRLIFCFSGLSIDKTTLINTLQNAFLHAR